MNYDFYLKLIETININSQMTQEDISVLQGVNMGQIITVILITVAIRILMTIQDILLTLIILIIIIDKIITENPIVTKILMEMPVKTMKKVTKSNTILLKT